MSDDLEARIESRIDKETTRSLVVSAESGGLVFSNMSEVAEFAKLMAVSRIAIPKHLRDNPGACLAVTMQAIQWRFDPFQVANKSYSVNDRLAYESQLIQAVILQRAPITGRFRVDYAGDGPERRCIVAATLADGTGEVRYASPRLADIRPKNSPLWQTDPDQQQFYYAARALCRRYFPDVLLGVYSEDELERPSARVRRINPLEDDIEAEYQAVPNSPAPEERNAPAHAVAGEQGEAATTASPAYDVVAVPELADAVEAGLRAAGFEVVHDEEPASPAADGSFAAANGHRRTSNPYKDKGARAEWFSGYDDTWRRIKAGKDDGAEEKI